MCIWTRRSGKIQRDGLHDELVFRSPIFGWPRRTPFAGPCHFQRKSVNATRYGGNRRLPRTSWKPTRDIQSISGQLSVGSAMTTTEAGCTSCHSQQLGDETRGGPDFLLRWHHSVSGRRAGGCCRLLLDLYLSWPTKTLRKSIEEIKTLETLNLYPIEKNTKMKNA